MPVSACASSCSLLVGEGLAKMKWWGAGGGLSKMKWWGAGGGGERGGGGS